MPPKKKPDPVADPNAPAPVKTSLFDLTTEYLDLIATLEESEGDVTKEQEAQLTGVGTAIPAKVDSYYRVHQLLLRREAGLGDEIKALQARRTVTKNALARLDRMMGLAMERMQTDALYGNSHKVGVAAVGGKRAVEVVATGDQLPDPLVVVEVTRKPDTEFLRDALYEAEKDPAYASFVFDNAHPNDARLDVVRLPDETIHLTLAGEIVATLLPRGTRLAWD